MSPRLYHGSCHCKTVQFTATLDLSQGTTKCNCTICLKTRSWEALTKPDNFTITQGGTDMQEYRFGKMVFPHYFCKHCGVHTHITGDIPPLGGELVMVQVNCLDDAEPEEIGEAPIKFINNLEDKPSEQPKYVGHL